MLAFLHLIRIFIANLFKLRLQLEIENLFLRSRSAQATLLESALSEDLGCRRDWVTRLSWLSGTRNRRKTRGSRRLVRQYSRSASTAWTWSS
jgi:hypothetical protein